MTALNSEGLEKAADALAKIYHGEGDEPFHLMATTAISEYLSALPPVDGLEVVAFRHPESDWAHVQYSEIDMHCRKDGPRPTPLVTLSQASSVIAGLRDELYEAQTSPWPTWAEEIRVKLMSYGVDPGDEWNVAEQFEEWVDGVVESSEARISSLEEENKRLREALKPFADYLAEMPFDLDNKGNALPDDTRPGWTYLTAGDFRRARQTLEDHNG